jgi:hypothetical protein
LDNRRYIGMDVHQASISIAVIDAAGKLLMECVIETKAGTIVEFIRGPRGSLWVTFEEGTSTAWLYDLLNWIARGQAPSLEFSAHPVDQVPNGQPRLHPESPRNRCCPRLPKSAHSVWT